MATTIAVVTGLGAHIGLVGTPAQATGSTSADAALYDPGPPWAPDYPLLCEILERYGNADIDACTAGPVGHHDDGSVLLDERAFGEAVRDAVESASDQTAAAEPITATEGPG